MEYVWRTGRYCVFKNFLHFVFVTKYRKRVFTKEILTDMKETINEGCQQLGGELLEFGGEEDHIHIMASVPPKVAVCNFVGRLKGKSSYEIRKKYGQSLKSKLWGNHLWSPSYCAVSCGGAPLEIVKKYIENQRKPPSEKAVKQSLQEKGRYGEKSRRKTKRGHRA